MTPLLDTPTADSELGYVDTQPHGTPGRRAATEPSRRRTPTAGLLVRKPLVALIVIAPFVATGVAVTQLWDRAVTWRDLALLIGLYVPISLGVTAGFHRMLTHRSFRAHPVARAVILILGSMAVEGAAIGWAANHLKHHALSDKTGDPHSPLDGLLHAHLGWLFNDDRADPATYCRFLLKDPVVVFVDRTFGLWVVLSLVIPFALGGWTGLLWGGLVRMFFVHHVTWSVNSVCHTFGRRAFVTSDRSRNQWMVGLLGMGEGWHNNHHAFPRSAVHGFDRWQLDVSGWMIAALERVGLATEVQRIPLEALARKRLTS
jgi:stearoyl-CoA desaturase (Delta-9 desaturase)